MDDPLKLIGIAAGALSVVAGCARWLISKYFETAKQLESLKEQNTKDALAQLTSLSAGLRTDLSSLSDQIKELKAEIEAIRHLAQDLQLQQSAIHKKLKPFKDKKLVRFADDLYALKKSE